DLPTRSELIRDGAPLQGRRLGNVDAAGDLRQPHVREGCVDAGAVDAGLRRGTTYRLRLVAAYASMVAGGIALFLLIRGYGETLAAPAPAAKTATTVLATAAAPNALFHVLVALAAVIVLGRVLGALLQSVGQPPVVGEVL